MSENHRADETAYDQVSHARTVFVLAVLLISLVGGALLYARTQTQAEEREDDELVDDFACAIALDEGRVPSDCADSACEALRQGQPVPLPEVSLGEFCDRAGLGAEESP